MKDTYSRHYCYSIVFADGFTYFGVRTCQCPIASDSYTGSPKTYAAKWLTDMSRVKTVISVHATRHLANEAEAKLIRDFWAISKALSLNTSIHGAKFSMLGRPVSDKAKAKISKSLSGKPVSDETKAKISKAATGRPVSDKAKAKLSKTRKGRRWYTDGVTEIRLPPNANIPEGFSLGRTKRN
jgi:hypothetical protein